MSSFCYYRCDLCAKKMDSPRESRYRIEAKLGHHHCRWELEICQSCFDSLNEKIEEIATEDSEPCPCDCGGRVVAPELVCSMQGCERVFEVMPSKMTEAEKLARREERKDG